MQVAWHVCVRVYALDARIRCCACVRLQCSWRQMVTIAVYNALIDAMAAGDPDLGGMQVRCSQLFVLCAVALFPLLIVGVVRVVPYSGRTAAAATCARWCRTTGRNSVAAAPCPCTGGTVCLLR